MNLIIKISIGKILKSDLEVIPFFRIDYEDPKITIGWLKWYMSISIKFE